MKKKKSYTVIGYLESTGEVVFWGWWSMRGYVRPRIFLGLLYEGYKAKGI